MGGEEGEEESARFAISSFSFLQHLDACLVRGPFPFWAFGFPGVCSLLAFLANEHTNTLASQKGPPKKL